MSGRSIAVPKPVKRRPIPSFSSEDQEREFWAKKDSSKFIDWSQADSVSLPNLRPSTRTISIRLPEPMIDRLKVLANKRDVPYQSLLKLFVAERIEEELREQ
jgi:predicted DNA binding CopG/RHH family protein